MKEFVFNARFEHSNWLSEEATKLFSIEWPNTGYFIFQAEDESMAERLAYEALENLVEQEELFYICNDKYGTTYTTAGYIADHIGWHIETLQEDDYLPRVLEAIPRKDINELIQFVQSTPPVIVEYIAVYHWEGHSAEAPVKIEAENEDYAEATLLAEAIKWTEREGSHLDCDEETTAKDYVDDYFHIDVLLPIDDIPYIQRIAGGK